MLLGLRRALLAAWSRRPAKPGTRVLAYHHLPSPELFRAHLDRICSMASLIDESALLAALPGPSSPPGRCTVMVTFDDGYRSSVGEESRAVAREYGLRPTVFVLAAIVDPGLGTPRGLITDEHGQPSPLCSVADLERAVSDGWTIGSHTATHWDCGSGSPDDFEREISGSRTALETALGVRVRSFAYPWGRRSNTSGEAARWVTDSGYEASFTTRRGLIDVSRAGVPHLLPRDVVESWWGPREVAGCLAGGLDLAARRWHHSGSRGEAHGVD